MEASQKVKNITIKTLDGTISIRKPNGDMVQVSHKCADVNLEMFHSLGVSKPILNYVIFCHQEESNWPLEEGSKVKDKFDEIFSSAKYQKCLKNIKEVRKAEQDKAKLEKNNAAHYKSDKEEVDRKNKDLGKRNAELLRLKTDIEKVGEKIKPIMEALTDIKEEEKGFEAVKIKLTGAQKDFDNAKEEREKLEKQITEILPESLDIEEIEQKKNGIEKETKRKEVEMKSLEETTSEQEKELLKSEKQIQKNAALIGQALEEKKQFTRCNKEKEKLIEGTSEDLGLVDDGDFVSLLDKEEKKVLSQINNIKAQNKENYHKITDEIDKLKSKKTGLEEKKKRELTDRMTHNKEIAELKKQLHDLEGATEKLARIKKDWEVAGARLEKEQSKYDLKALVEEIEQEKSTLKELEGKERRIKEERKGLDEKQSLLQKISHVEADMKLKQTKLEKLSNKRHSDFFQLFKVIPDHKRLKAQWKSMDEETESRRKHLETTKANLEAELRSKENNREDSNRIIAQKMSHKQKLETAVGGVIGPGEDLDEELAKVKEDLEIARKELQVKEAGKFTYRDMIKKMQQMDCPACPTCNRAFIKKDEADELMADLEELIGSIPNKVKSLQAKVRKHTERQDSLLKISPDAHLLKNLKKEIEDNGKKIMAIDSEIKSLNKKLDDDEDLDLVSNTASILKQVSEDVQSIDSLSKEVEALRESKEELELQVEGGVGRDIEDVRREEEEISEKIRIVRKNMDQCQETVSTQSALINDLESKKNKLTERKLDIEGQQQQRANMMDKKTELETKVSKTESEIKKCDQDLEPVREELEETESKKRKLTQEGDKAVETVQLKMRKVQNVSESLKKLVESIKKYEEDGKHEELEKLCKDKEDIEQIIQDLRFEKKETEEKSSELRVDISNQESRRRMYDDNIRFREYKEKEKKFERQIKRQNKELEDMDWKKVVDKKSKLTKEYHKLFAEQSEKEGQVAELTRTIKSIERELQDPKWKDASKNYKEQTIKHKLRTEMVSDLNKYWKALNCAILKFHSQKMKVVNKIIRELWKQTYKGNDIDYIEIKTDDGFDGPNYGAEKRKVHNYRVVMFKHDAELDMRGRCSAGQKVLACLIIRLALAETFSANCGVIALDEPTTNLDRENIESLANALADLVLKRSQQRNFQLVVITHDEDFIEQLSRCDAVQHFQRVSRNHRGLSMIRKENVNNLEAS